MLKPLPGMHELLTTYLKEHPLMPDPQISAQPPDPIHTKLLDVDLDLAAQETELIAQLEAVQEKRKGLKTVMELFGPANTPAAETTSNPEPVAEVLTAPPLEPVTLTPTVESQVVSDPLPQVPKQTTPPAKKRRTTQSAKTKTTKQSPDWQPYIRAELGQTSLAEIVPKILQDQPDEVFGIPTMVHTIFVDKIPKGVWNQARNRISNILAEGARKNRWYRDQTGQYSLSPAVVGA